MKTGVCPERSLDLVEPFGLSLADWRFVDGCGFGQAVAVRVAGRRDAAASEAFVERDRGMVFQYHVEDDEEVVGGGVLNRSRNEPAAGALRLGAAGGATRPSDPRWDPGGGLWFLQRERRLRRRR